MYIAMNTTHKPLAERMRPKTLDEIVGQEHLVGAGNVLRRMAEQKQLVSMIFWGPPGTGKTTLARLLSQAAALPFFGLSAVLAGVSEVRKVIEQGRRLRKVVLFLDEIHRFSKSQQDALLADVEKGSVILIGATTENPSFEVIPALLSRCCVYCLYPLSADQLRTVLRRAIEHDVVLRERRIVLQQDAALLRFSAGDARKLLNLIEQVVQYCADDPLILTDDLVCQVAQLPVAKYDKGGDQHYDMISAFIKSIRGSDPNAAVYWLARMLAGGEDPLFIARRMVILASEDIGNAQPAALPLATACFEVLERIGMPEGRIVLSQTAVYLACAPKSNSAYLAIEKAMTTVRQTGDLPVPLHLRNAPTPLMQDLGYGQQYRYVHDWGDHFADQEYMPDALQGMVLYEPAANANEEVFRAFLKQRWKAKYGY